MASKKTTRSAVLMSFTALLLCASMLIATTFAWFTDSVTSSGNIIKSGTLDVEMYWAEGTEDPADANTTWTDAATGAIFNYDLWEPGYAEVRHIKIKNVGTLALKYQLNILANGGASDLTDAIDVYFTDPATQVTDRAQLIDTYKVDTLTKVLAGMPGNAAGNLGAGNEATVTIALKMQEEAGNEYQDKSVGTDFSVQLVATQMTAETDSFDNQYDKEALFPVLDAAGLSGAIAEGKDVKLDADIALTEAIAVDENVTVDLNGHELDASATASAFTVTNGATLTVNGSDEEVQVGANGLAEIPAGNDATVVINGGSYVSDDAASTLVKPNGTGAIKLVLNDVDYKNTSSNGKVLSPVGYEGTDFTVEINGGSFEATTGLLLPAGSSVNGAEITAKNTKNMQPAIYALGDMTIENCIIKAEKSHAVAVGGGATLTVNNCEVYAGSDAGALAFQVFGSGGTINVNNTTFTGGYGTTGKISAGCVAIINIDGVEKYRKG